MASAIRHVTVDCIDVELVGTFWAAALGYGDDPENPNGSGDPEWIIVPRSGTGPGVLFVPVPEAKAGKNRLHLDLVPSTTREEEVERLRGLGATVVDDRRNPDGTGWVVMADPEGNELCVERAVAERS